MGGYGVSAEAGERAGGIVNGTNLASESIVSLFYSTAEEGQRADPKASPPFPIYSLRVRRSEPAVLVSAALSALSYLLHLFKARVYSLHPQLFTDCVAPVSGLQSLLSFINIKRLLK